jgi:C1A family cysteine protease
MSRYIPRASGWRRDLPDFRDFTVDHVTVQAMLSQLPGPDGSEGDSESTAATSVDLREFFSDVDDQQDIHCSPALACASLVEYFELRSHGRIAPSSALYLYKSARKLAGSTGDTGIDLRTVLKGMVRFGIPPDRLWAFDPATFDQEPDPYLHAYSAESRSVVYVRLDAPNTRGVLTLNRVKSFLAAGFPVAFGFSLPSALSRHADIPYRPTHDSVVGGQAVVAVGFDDHRIRTTKGALLIRNSWGPGWGDNGYGWLPYAYVERQSAVDFWTLLQPGWLSSGEFSQPDLSVRRRRRHPNRKKPPREDSR